MIGEMPETGFVELMGGGAIADDPEIYDGCPVSVQLIGRRLQEEKVLAITEYVAGVLKE